MKTIVILVFGLFFTGVVYAQIGSSISSDGTAPNDNAMLDVQSPATGDGKGMLIPRVTLAQRTTANASLAGGLLDGSGNLRGGAAQGLIVYQTDGSQGLYFNTSQTTAPAWVYLGTSTTNYLPLTGGTMSGALNMGGQPVTNAVYYGNGSGITNIPTTSITESDPRWASASNSIVTDIANRLASNVWAAADSTTNYLPRTGGTMSGALNMGGQIVSNVSHVDFNGTDVSVGRMARGLNYGSAVGASANGSTEGTAVGYEANGYNQGVAIGRLANGSAGGAVLGYEANGLSSGAAIGSQANGYFTGAAVGTVANGYFYGAAVGNSADGTNYGAAIGREANGNNFGAALGYLANGSVTGVAVGASANGYNLGAAVGNQANGSSLGTALGYLANGSQTNVAIGVGAKAEGGIRRIVIGHETTNSVDDSAVIRGHLYLDGGTGVWYRSTFGNGSWTAKAFEIDHPLDPENKILRHFCLEGPQVWNVYAGNAQLVNGQAVVHLPDYYSALNLVGSEIYSLTPIGGRTPTWVQVKEEVKKNRFVIEGSSDMKVSWTIKVLRNDPGCLEDLKMRPVEQLKSEIK